MELNKEQMESIAKDIAKDLKYFIILDSCVDLSWFIDRGYLGDADAIVRSVLGDWFDNPSLDHLMAVGFETGTDAIRWLASKDEATYTCMVSWLVAEFRELEQQILIGVTPHYWKEEMGIS